MLRFVSYDIVFQEVPDEVTLAINISNCPLHCRGCHSRYLWEDKGDLLNEDVFMGLLERYGNAITCICFMGGDVSPAEVDSLASFIKIYTEGRIKTAWYSGRTRVPAVCSLSNFDYIKLGPYMENLGGLDNPATNQRFYKVKELEMIDMTYRFRKSKSVPHTLSSSTSATAHS